jgi:SAM-dependent methyltransferase
MPMIGKTMLDGGSPLRRPHAVLDVPSRHLKAKKIEQLLQLTARSDQIRLLEIGCGSGGISHYFSAHTDMQYVVDAVDVVDHRLVKEGYNFRLVNDVHLPFPNSTFDVVITNHVIEHVGDKAQQTLHLSEVHRVLKPDGIGYLAVPNRWQVVEPHYRLAFLSWLPRSFRTPYLKLMRRGANYDCEPLGVNELEFLLAEAGFTFENVCKRSARLMFELERPEAAMAALVLNLPDSFFEILRALIPTLTYLLHPNTDKDQLSGVKKA